MDDNIWEYPFGDPEDDDDYFFHGRNQAEDRPVFKTGRPPRTRKPQLEVSPNLG